MGRTWWGKLNICCSNKTSQSNIKSCDRYVLETPNLKNQPNPTFYVSESENVAAACHKNSSSSCTGSTNEAFVTELVDRQGQRWKGGQQQHHSDLKSYCYPTLTPVQFRPIVIQYVLLEILTFGISGKHLFEGYGSVGALQKSWPPRSCNEEGSWWNGEVRCFLIPPTDAPV